MAHRDPEISPADGDRLQTQRNPRRTLRQKPERRVRRQALRRLLHAGRHPRNRALRRRASYRSDSRDRNARTRTGGADLLSVARMHGRSLLRMDPLGNQRRRLLRRQGDDIRIRRGGAFGSARPLSLETDPHRRRRVSQKPLESVSALPAAHPRGGAQRRIRTAKLLHPPDRTVDAHPRPRDHRLGRDSPGRRLENGDRHVMERQGTGHQSRTAGKSGHHGPQMALLFRLQPNVRSRPLRTAGQSPLRPGAAGLPPRTLRPARAARPEADHGRAMQSLDGVHRRYRTCTAHGAAAHGGSLGDRLGLRPQGLQRLRETGSRAGPHRRI